MKNIIASENVNVHKDGNNFIIDIPADSKEIIKFNLNDVFININAGKGSDVKIIGLSKGEVLVNVDENAKVEYVSIQKTDDESSLVKKAVVGKNGIINWVDCCIGGSLNKSFIRTELNGEGSQSETMSVIFGHNKENLQIDNEVVHNGNQSQSNMLSRVVLDDNAIANYNGLVKVALNAKNCKGYQKKETILLSENAKINAIPNLEIQNNDVMCSHGATISQIDSNKLFYMMSRGIDEKDAKKIIIEGFFDPILIKVDDDGIENEIKEAISGRL